MTYLDSSLTSNSINANYTYSKFFGHLTVPVGDPTFIAGTSISGTTISCNTVLYSITSNNFALPVFVDANDSELYLSNGVATLLYNAPPYSENNMPHGHLVVPVFQESVAQNYYATLSSTGVVVLPSNGSPQSLQSQIVWVPQGTSY